MKNIIKFFIGLNLLLLLSCSSDKQKEISILNEDEIEMQMIVAYNEGLDALNEGDSLKAAKKFNEAELLFPQSEWAPKSSLMAAYSYYADDYNDDAIFQLEQFIKIYPKSKRMQYAHYLIAMSYYNKITDEKKDSKPMITAKEKFEFVISNYPNSDYGLDSKFKLDLIEETLASKEMFVAKHYIKKQKWIPAINRLKFIVENYETTIYVEEAIHRLVEVYFKIGLIDESKKYANLLGYNYLSGKWYEESYKVFNKKYESPYKKIKRSKKSSLIKKIKSVIE
tara:strand:+ start:2822 stop:3664 length:843 start_codon:yes stop_codon:yes gene_type:complete